MLHIDNTPIIRSCQEGRITDLHHFGDAIQPLDFLAATGILAVNLMFYETLTLMLGAFSDHRGPVIGLPLTFLFLQQYIVGFYQPLVNVLPYTLAVPLGEGIDSIVSSVLAGASPHSWLPLITTAAWSILFVALAVWRFSREEF